MNGSTSSVQKLVPCISGLSAEAVTTASMLRSTGSGSRARIHELAPPILDPFQVLASGPRLGSMRSGPFLDFPITKIGF